MGSSADSRRHLFFDNRIINCVQDLTRVMHHPQRVDQSPLLVPDQPWEHRLSFFSPAWSLIPSPQEGLLRLWYTDWWIDLQAFSDTQVDITDPRISGTRMCYAVSGDGLRWHKPQLEYCVEEDRRTNIVFGTGRYGPQDFGSVHAITVIEDPLDGDPDRRYKLLFQHIALSSAGVHQTSDGTLPVLQSPIRMAYSADGIRWTPSPERLDFGGLGPKLGDVMRLTTEEERGHYVLYTRHPHAWNPPLNPKDPRTAHWSLPYYPQDRAKMNKRRIWRCESADLIHWNEPYEVLVPDDAEDNLDDSFDSLCPFRVGDTYVGFLNLIHAVGNTMDTQLVFSRDGQQWQRAGARRPFLAPGPPGSWEEALVTMPVPPLEVEGEYHIYYGGANHHHSWWIFGKKEGLQTPEATAPFRFHNALGLAKLRVDGFVSLYAGLRNGLLITKPVDAGGNGLVINARCEPGGSVAVELASAQDDVLPGYERDRCDIFRGDAVRHTVTWAGNSTCEHLGQVKLRVYLHKAHLYSVGLRSRTETNAKVPEAAV